MDSLTYVFDRAGDLSVESREMQNNVDPHVKMRLS